MTTLETYWDAPAVNVALPRRGLPDPTQPLAAPLQAACVHDAFVARAQALPDAPALIASCGTCSYAQLEAISAGLAHTLAARGVGRGATVAIWADRSPALVYAVLGVLRSGAAFQIVDAAYPPARALACLTQTAPAQLLVTGDLPLPQALMDGRAEAPIRIPAEPQAALRAFAETARGLPLPRVDPAGVAYVSFTSGSTGTPKGIVTGHAPLPHFVAWQVAHGGLTERDRFSMLSGLSHDPLLRDVFTPLSIGAALHIPTQATIFDADALWRWFARERVSVAHMTPAMGEILVAGAPEGAILPELRRVYWGGDRLPPRLSARLGALAPSALQTNCYGATETPQVMAYFDLTDLHGADEVPIGRGIDDAQLLLVDERGKLCGVGEPGEIWIRSPYLARGYLDDPHATESRFVASPFTGDPRDVCYRTGDRGRYRKDGAVLFAGRGDRQLKVRGFRVEPAEIVRALEDLPEVGRAIVLAPERDGEPQLVGYVVPAAGHGAAPAALREALAQTLPSYMIPKHLVVLPAFPMLPNGKVDLRALPEPGTPSTPAGPARRLPRNETERRLAAIWAEILGLDEVGIDDDFLTLGGDSLSAIRALARMRRLGIPDEVARGIFQGRTIAELSEGRAESTRPGPLVGPARTMLLINVLRGLLVCLLVFDHWREGIFKRLQLPATLTDTVEFIFHLPTPGFAFVFGLGLGYTHYPSFLRNPAASRRLLQGGALLLAGGTLVMGLSRNLGVLAKGQPLDYDLFSTNFFLPTLYYWLALATAPLWFSLMARREGKWGGSLLACLLLAAGCRGLYELSRFLLLEHEQVGLLQLGRLMLTARFSYFNLSTGALMGIFFGLFLRRERARPHLVPELLGFGAMTLAVGLGAYLLQRERYPEGLMSADIWLPEWMFYLGLTLLLGALVEALLSVSHVAPVRAVLAWIGVVGQCAMPIFILQGMVFDVTAFGRALGLRDSLAVALAMFGFVLTVGWMMRRIHALYYGGVARAPAHGRPLSAVV